MQELRVVGVRVELPGNQPILLLKETQGERYLPIWIGAVEAAAIAFEQQGVRPARPMTHDLLREVVRALGATLEAVNITEMRDGIYIAELVFGDERVVSARPSDAVALAVRTARKLAASLRTGPRRDRASASPGPPRGARVTAVTAGAGAASWAGSRPAPGQAERPARRYPSDG